MSLPEVFACKIGAHESIGFLIFPNTILHLQILVKVTIRSC